MNRRNMQRELETIIKENDKNGVYPKLLLHACCAPCSSYCLEYLSNYFDITVFYYNPNIDEKVEYSKRVDEEKRLISEMPLKRKVSFIEGIYNPEVFHELSRGHEHDKEGGERCMLCYELRLRESAKIASQQHFDYFTTTLSISPLKNAEKLCEIGERLGKEYDVIYLPSDFKKREGYKRSIELSNQYSLYRQNFCGCYYSKNETTR